MKIELSLKNCFGIEEMHGNLDFNKGNVIAIYSKNGTMKTSLAKTFKKIQTGNPDSIRDEIFNIPGTADIKIEDNQILPEQVFVIESFEEKYESKKLLSLLVSDETREITKDLLNKKDILIKNLNKQSGISKSQIEKIILEDFSTPNSTLTSLVKDLNQLPKHSDFNLKLKYVDIFDETLKSKILSDSFQKDINNYIKARKNIYRKYKFLETDSFDFTNFRDFTDTVKKSKYFSPSNKIELKEKGMIGKIEEFEGLIEEINDEFRATEYYQKLEKELRSSRKAKNLLTIIEQTPEIIEKLKKDNIEQFKRDLWASYLRDNLELTEEIENLYKNASKRLKEEIKKRSEWQEILDKFNERFDVPFEMLIKNTEELLLGEEVPRVIFRFKKGGYSPVEIDRPMLENKNTLSRGEKRALYLLNILFDIESLKKERNNPILLVIDDIADSFDYQNKYAIIEYLSDLCEENSKFKLLILSHNFDFYRTVCSRLSISRAHRLHTSRNNNIIELIEEKYQKEPINSWRDIRNIAQAIALIPLARNLSQYKKGESKTDLHYKNSEDLASALHIKPKDESIKVSRLGDLFELYIKIKRNFLDTIDQNKYVTDLILETANDIKNEPDPQLEHKITLSIAIRLKAERFMIDSLLASGKYSCEEDITKDITKNQTRVLFDKYKKVISSSTEKVRNLKILSRINIITPEHIHLNSFMYEPILDTDIKDLIKLYEETSKMEILAEK